MSLQKFLDAQSDAVMRSVMDELAAGRKQTHWMWFVFPQVLGLGESNYAKLYGIRSLDEARDYWAHPILGDRLRTCIQLALTSKQTALDLFGKQIDAQKFQSCLTLFSQVEPGNLLLKSALHQFYNDENDKKTLQILKGSV